MPTLLRMPDELHERELRSVVCPRYAFRTLRDTLAGYPFAQPAFRSHLLDFLARNYRALDHLLEDAFQALQVDLARGRVLIMEDMPMIRAYHWQPANAEHAGRWVVPGYVFAEHRGRLQLALDNARRDVPGTGAREVQEAAAGLKPGDGPRGQKAKNPAGEVLAPASPASAAAPCSGRFQLIDQETGKPVAGRKVRVWSSGGWSAIDTTDAEGMTSWVNHDASESIYINLVQGGEA